MATARIEVRGLKINTLIPPASLPADLVPPEPAPAGAPMIELALGGSGLVVHVLLNGRSVRRALKTIAEHGPDGVNVVLQGTLAPGALPDSFVLDGAGITATPRVAKGPKGEAAA